MEIQGLSAIQNYTSARAATNANPTAGAAASLLQETARDFAATLQAGETAAVGAMSGQSDPHTLVQALAQSELAVETAVTVRNKVVEAYQEILRMPV